MKIKDQVLPEETIQQLRKLYYQNMRKQIAAANWKMREAKEKEE